MLEELSSKEAQESIETINASGSFSELRDAHQAFIDTYQAKVSAESQTDYPQVRIATARVRSRIDALLCCLTTLSDFAEQEDDEQAFTIVSELIRQVNEIITEVMAIARARRTRESSGI